MKKIQIVCLLITMMIVVKIDIAVAVAQTDAIVCEDYSESFDGTTLPSGWSVVVNDPVSETGLTTRNDNVQWALNTSDQYCGIENLFGSGKSLCASSENALNRGENALGYNTVAFSPWFKTSNIASMKIGFDLNYQSFSASDGLRLIIQKSSEDGISNPLATYTEDVGEFKDGGETIPPITVNLDHIAPDVSRFAWEYYDTGGDEADWYVQIDDVQITCIESIEDRFDVTGGISLTETVIVTETVEVPGTVVVTGTVEMTETIVVTQTFFITVTDVQLVNDTMTDIWMDNVISSTSPISSGVYTVTANVNFSVEITPMGHIDVEDELQITVTPEVIQLFSWENRVEEHFTLIASNDLFTRTIGMIDLEFTNRKRTLFLPFVTMTPEK